MKVLQVHNVYIGKTGEEAVVTEEKKVLEKYGHDVIQLIKDNSELTNRTITERLKVYASLTGSKSIALELEDLLDREQPDVCHVHNTFPLITPIVYKVCHSKAVPVVQTLHNYKMVCTNSLLFRNGEVCEACLNKSLYNSIKFKCYRDSYTATAMQAHVIQYHRNKDTWINLIDKYICLTEFQKDKLVSGGMNEDRLVVKPNFLSEDGKNITREDFFLFVGRLNDSKGLQDLLHLFNTNRTSKFILIGKSETPEIFNQFDNVIHMGEQDRSVVLTYMRKCKAVLFPSKYYEGMPIVILEAFSHKKPVISRNTGAMSSMIESGRNGLKYEDRDEFVSAVAKFQTDNEWVETLGEAAFSDYQEKYSETKGYENLINVYSSVLANRVWRDLNINK